MLRCSFRSTEVAIEFSEVDGKHMFLLPLRLDVQGNVENDTEKDKEQINKSVVEARGTVVEVSSVLLSRSMLPDQTAKHPLPAVGLDLYSITMQVNSPSHTPSFTCH